MIVDIEAIEPGTRLRGINTEQVEALVTSIAEVGLLSPITVYPRQVIRANIAVDGYGLVAGLHRWEACGRLGLAEIEANVVTLGELERQIAECDENLCGTKLSPAERALFTRRRKDAYEALHPETRHGATGNGREKSCQDGDSIRFTKDTADRSGRSERVVQRDATRGERIDENVLADIAGGELDRGATLDALAAIPKDQQAAKLRDLNERNKARSDLRSAGDTIVKDDSADAAATILCDELHPDTLEQLLLHLDACAATRVSRAVRRALLDRNGRRNHDAPVFDNTPAGGQ